MKHHNATLLTAAAASLALAGACAPPQDDNAPSEPDDMDETGQLDEANADLAGEPAPTPEEAGLVAADRWMPKMNAFRGKSPILHLENGRSYHRAFAGDNAFILWAFSKPRYAYARHVGWADGLRDFLLDMEFANGQFREGRVQGPAGDVMIVPDPDCGPSTDAKILVGLIAYTKAFPDRRGARPAAKYESEIGRILRAQHGRFMASVPPNTLCDADKGTWGQGQGKKQRDYSKPSSLVLHLWNLAEWTSKGGGDFRRMAEEAWQLLKSQLHDSQIVKGDGDNEKEGDDDDEDDKPGFRVLPNAKALYVMTRTLELLGDLPGLRNARNTLRTKLHVINHGAALKIGSAIDTDTQGAGFHVMASEHRPASLDLVFANRLCLENGRSFRGKSDGYEIGPVEDIALGMLATWRALKEGWLDTQHCVAPTSCIVHLPACPTNTTAPKQIHDTWMGSSVNAAQCKARASAWATHCQGDHTTVYTAEYRNRNGVAVAWNPVLNNGCLIYLSVCRNNPGLQLRFYGDPWVTDLGNQALCLQRARDWHAYCGNAPAEWTNAMHYVNGQQTAATFYRSDL